MINNINNIVIFSGGSGNDAILEGLIKYGEYTDKNINIIVNAYDDGKSTGVCREVTNTLGVSDIRKNHYKLHKLLKGDHINESLIKWYEDRLDIDKNFRTGNSVLDNYIVKFFNNPNASLFSYKNFNVMNIIYSQLYREEGYEKTNSIFSNFLGIKDIVKLNSFDNIKIVASTEEGKVITDEGDLVEFCNFKDRINDIYFVGKSTYGLNDEAIKLVKEADLIIISSGTFWSSLYPTFKYLDFYKYINKSKANKLWIMNSSEDKDTYGVSNVDMFIDLQYLGIDFSKFKILINNDASEILRKKSDIMDVFTVHKSLGNKKGKHDSKLLWKAIEEIYG